MTLFISLLAILGNIFLAFFILRKDAKSFSSIVFALLNVALAAWTVFNYMSTIADTADATLTWVRLVMAFVVFQVFLFALFVEVFPQRNWNVPWTRRVLFTLPAIAAAVLSILPFVFTEMIHNDSGYTPRPGPGMAVFMPTIIGYISFSAYHFYKKYSAATGILKQQFKYLLLGGSLMFISMIAFLLVPVVIFENTAFIPLGPVCTYFFLIAATYAMLRYRLMDIRFVIRQMAIYGILISLSLAMFWLTYVLLQLTFKIQQTYEIAFAGTVAITSTVLGYNNLKKQVESVTDLYLFMRSYDPQKEILSYSRHLVGKVALGDINEEFIDVIERTLKPQGTVLWASSSQDENDRFQPLLQKGNIARLSVEFSKEIIQKAGSLDSILVTDEIPLRNREEEQWKSVNTVYKSLKNKHVAVTFFLRSKERIIGLLMLSDKKSEDGYTSEDIHFLELISNQTAVALDNALLYDDLENRIDRRTREISEKNRTLSKLLKDLEVANDHLRQLDQAKTEFLSIASHQLRTPLSAIRGYLSMLEDGDFGEVTEKQRAVLQKTEENTHRLASLVSDLLSLARIEAGTGPKGLNYESLDLRIILDDIFDELKLKAEKRGIKLIWKRPKKAITVDVDRKNIEQVIMNLADNAVHYTTDGSVTLKLETSGEKVIYSVSDTGIGIGEEEKKRLFTKFYRSPTAIKVRPDGSGIGLYVVKTIVEAHGGNISLESESGKGTTFLVEIPRTH